MGASTSSPCPDVTSVSGCPPITLSTFTTHTEYYTSVWVGTTVYLPASSATETIYVTSTNQRVASTTTTLPTATVSATVTTTITESAQETVTIPTASGFTPVLCEARYYDPTVTIADTVTRTYGTITTYSNTPATGNGYVSTFTFYEDIFTSTVTYTESPTLVVTVTQTSTIPADKTTTIYDACATNNIATSFPNGDSIYAVLVTYSNSSGPNTYMLNVDAVDAVACCAQCQANSTCTGSGFNPYHPATPYLGSCVLFLQQPGLFDTCDPHLVAQKAVYPIPKGLFPADFSISNSACGQYLIDTTPINVG